MPKANLTLAIQRLAKKFSGTFGVAAHDCATGAEIFYNADVVFPTASMVKLGILLELFRQREANQLSLDEQLTVHKADKTSGSGLLENMSDEVTLSLHDLAVLMNAISDNTATNVLIERLGIVNINRAMQEAGMSHTTLFRKIVFAGNRKLKYPNFATGTPRDFMTLLLNLYEGKLLNKQHTKAMLTIMRIQKNMGNLVRYVKFNPYGDDKQAWVASKTGSITGARNESGIVHTAHGAHIVAVMSKECKDEQWTPDNEGTVLVATVSKLIYDEWRK
jgi:beta-lactamase class A